MVKTASPPSARAVIARYEQARAHHRALESLWRDCYDYALPYRGDGPSANPGDHLFDATALDSVDQLAASLLAHVTPPWTDWFGFRPGPDLGADDAARLAPALDRAAKTVQAHFDQSNFAMEIHQCYLDLVVGGTASLLFQENDPGAFSAFRFASVPLSRAVMEEGADGRLENTYRRWDTTIDELARRFPGAQVPDAWARRAVSEPQSRFPVLEAVMRDGPAFHLILVAIDTDSIVFTATLDQNPFINFRWMKSPGDVYGRSPVMKALPDIKTANRVVELILKNASIAVTGMWQADDDGVLNVANIEFVPGAIIPKAVGSGGLKPLEMPGNFDVSQLVLNDLRGRIRHALLADRLGAATPGRMTATEILERSSEMALLLGANYGRLQTELLTPLVLRAHAVLRRRGEIPDLALDGRYVTLEYRSPLARAQGQRNIQNTLTWLDALTRLGVSGMEQANAAEIARFLGDALGVPSRLMAPAPETFNPLNAKELP